MLSVAELVKSFVATLSASFPSWYRHRRTLHSQCTRFSRSNDIPTPPAIGLESRATMLPVAKLVKSFGTRLSTSFPSWYRRRRTRNSQCPRFSRFKNPITPPAIGLESRATMLSVAELVKSFVATLSASFPSWYRQCRTLHSQRPRFSRSANPTTPPAIGLESRATISRHRETRGSPNTLVRSRFTTPPLPVRAY
ncbi:hypothetical protein Rcae01_01214 [Novipirellula caenicola]|uniref:Uncharacterized protein n=1 Tax=Novipirellula caenicola TaxID=1536901 RepID=A0ABP9VKP6_9BACT